MLRDIDDDRSDNMQIVIARDKQLHHHGSEVSPARTDISDAKTSDITKVSHARDMAGILHEKATSVSAS